MKAFKTILIIVGIFLMSTSIIAQEKTKKNNEKVKYWVSMDCENCKAKIEKNIAYEKGVKDMIVDLDTKTVTLTYKSGKTTPEKLEKAIQELGYKTERIESKSKEKEKEKKKKIS
jgi:copper chaperone CopZ